MFIEDLILNLARSVRLNIFDEKIVRSFETQIFIGSGFTEKQADLAIKILKRQKTKLESVLGFNIENFLENPTYKLKKREYNYSKTMEIFDHDRFQRAIFVTFPYNDEIVQTIRQNKTELSLAYWDPEKKSWIFPLNEKSLLMLMDISKKYEFKISEELQDYFLQVEEIKSNLENFAPVVSFENEKIKFQNFPNFTPTIDSSDVLESLFFARKVGINTWDESVERLLDEKFSHSPVKKFLNTDPSAIFEFHLENRSILDIKDIVKNLLPCIFVIPGGSEYEKLSTGLNLLETIGVDNSEISVLFRLPKETGEAFNSYIKEMKLNNPLNEKTKAIFISSKIPKPIIESNIVFNSVVNFNFYSVHYTIREFLKNHKNVITVFDKSPQRSINFASL